MTNTRSLLAFIVFTLGLLGFLPAARAAAPPAPIVVGAARFTVITPNCIRLEYAQSGKFIDAPSLFAVERSARDAGAKVIRSAKQTVIDTGAVRLTYTPDGQPFSASNLSAAVRDRAQMVNWKPGMPNAGNLGGTIRTLDGADGAEDLGQGVLSRDGWYLLDDSKSPLQTNGWVQSRPADSGMDWYFFGYGHNFHAALKSLTAIGGPVPLTRKYAMGSWYSRFWPYSSTDYHTIIDEFKQHDFPLDNIVLDMDWHRDGWTGWSWNRKLLPDAETLLPWFHSQGLHVTLNLHPADGVGPQEDAYPQFMRDMGADPATKQSLPFDAGSKKYMTTLFSDVFAPLEKAGVDFWWLDWQQYEHTRSIPDLTNLFWLNTLLYDRTAAGGERGLSFSRWAGWGDHRHPIHFSGDASTNFSMLAFEVPFTATAGNVGCFFWSHDIGGHNRGRNEESYARWVQFGAVSPVLRSHSTRDAAMDRRPWTYPKWAENSMRDAFHLRSRLFPYLYTSAAQSARDTVPLNRPLYVDSPYAEAAYHNAQEFLLGDNVLAAPIVAAGDGPNRVGTQTVWFPPGVWYNVFTGEKYAGGTDALVAADIAEFPLYMRGGVPVPMQPYQARMATAPLTTLRVVCWPGADGKTGRSTVYEDDGETTAYERGQSATTPLSYARQSNRVTVTVGAAKGHYKNQPAVRTLVVELPGTTKAKKVTFNGKPLPASACFYDAAMLTNKITLPAWPIGSASVVTAAAAPADLSRLHIRAMARHILGAGSEQTKLAAQGIGLVRKNEGAYLYHGTMRNTFYAPLGVIDDRKITVVGGQTLTLPKDGSPLVVRGTPHVWRGRTLYAPAQVAFSINGLHYVLPETPPLGNEVLTEDNLTQFATVTVSGVESGYSVDGATDGIVGGYPGPKSEEWSAGSKVGATLTLTWNAPQAVDRIALYDRPNLNDQITSGEITFSDGSTLAVGELPNDGKTPLMLRFPAKTITSLTFKVLGMTPASENAGLSEIAVYRAK